MPRRLALFYRRLAGSGPQRPLEWLLLWLLIPFGWGYGSVALLRVCCYRRGWLRRYRAPVPVISVGNLTVGGTGKTPMVDYLLQRLLPEGRRVAVVSRGYGGKRSEPVAVVSDGRQLLMEAPQCGDEPYLLARRNPQALVIVAARRALAIQCAVERYGCDVVVLDDGYQHLAVERDLDLLLFDSRQPLGNGRVLPAGLLREFPQARARADVCVFTRCEHSLPSLPCQQAVMTVSQHLAAHVVDDSGQRLSLAELRGRRCAAFAGIACPQDFFNALHAQGIELQACLPLQDHCCYQGGELAQLQQLASQVEVLLTTEKDAVKLGQHNFGVPCYAVALVFEPHNPQLLDEKLAALFAETGARRSMAPRRDDMDTDMSTHQSIDPALLKILVCPQCKGQLTLTADNTLHCAACCLAYPIRDNVAVMLIDEAESVEQ